MIIEICATSLESITNAQNAGAHRIELCEKHSIGGITPSKDFLIRAFEIIKIPTNVLIRPRGGNFIFSDREIEIMIDQINFFKTFKINGFVIGFINDNNKSRMKIIQSSVIYSNHSDKRYRIMEKDGNILISHKEGYLKCEEIQLENKKKMDAKSLLNGYKFSKNSFVLP